MAQRACGCRIYHTGRDAIRTEGFEFVDRMEDECLMCVVSMKEGVKKKVEEDLGKGDGR